MSTGTLPAPVRGDGPPPLATSALVTTFGHFAWLGWFWAGAAALCAGVVVVVGTLDGQMDSSFWHGTTSWMSWVVFAAGVTTVPVYAPLFVAHGVTRRQLSSSSMVSLAVLAALGGVIAVAGYAVEGALYGSVYDGLGWSQDLPRGQVGGLGSIALLGLRYAATLTCYFAAGWVVGAAWKRLSWLPFVLSLVPATLPVLAAEILLVGRTWLDVAALRDLDRPPLALGLLATAALAAATAAVAARITRDVAVEP